MNAAPRVITLSVPALFGGGWFVRRTEPNGRYAGEHHLGSETVSRIVHNASYSGEIGPHEPMLVQLLGADGEILDSVRVEAGLCRCEDCLEGAARRAHGTDSGPDRYAGLDDYV